MGFAFIDGNVYAVHASLMETVPLQVGERKNDGRMVVLKLKPGNKLYKLDFDLVEEKNAEQTTVQPAEVVLKGMFKNRSITSRINNAVELVPLVADQN